MRYALLIVGISPLLFACGSGGGTTGPSAVVNCEAPKSNDTAIAVVKCPDDHSTPAPVTVPPVPE